MVQTAAEARQELLERLSAAIRELGRALASLGAAYEQLDQHTAGELEEKLFLPVQRAYARARRTHDEFASRHGFPSGKFEPPAPGLPSTGTKAFVENAIGTVGQADLALTSLQDSLLPVDVGDAELRAELVELRELLASFSGQARELLRTLGR